MTLIGPKAVAHVTGQVGIGGVLGGNNNSYGVGVQYPLVGAELSYGIPLGYGYSKDDILGLGL